MKTNDQVYKISIEPLTPVYVGGATEKNYVYGLDVIKKDNTVYVIDHNKLANILKDDINLLQKYTLAALNRKLNYDFYKNHNLNIDDFTLHKFNFIEENDIKAFIRNGMGKPYLPGSSIKGAIRSALYHHLVKTIDNNRREIRNYEKEVFGEIYNNLMKFFQITDIPFYKTELVNTKIFTLNGNNSNFKGGWKNQREGGYVYEFKKDGFTTPYEILKINSKGIGIITFNQLFLDFINQNTNNIPPNIQKFNNNPIEVLFKLVNDYTHTHIDREINFFKKYENDTTDEILEEFGKLKNLISNNKRACILRLGGGSGFHSITGDWQFETHFIDSINKKKRNRGQYNEKDSAKTRKIAFIQKNENSFKFYPFGFVKISLISDEEYENLQKQLAYNQQVKSEISKTSVTTQQTKEVQKPKEPPKPFKGKIQQGIGKIPAKVVKSGKPNIVHILIEGNEKEMQLNTYSSELPEGTYVYVKITQFSKGEIKQVSFDGHY